jgi:hypothetical protein
MITDLENIDYRNIFPPGIPAPPSNPSLPPPMSQTPNFGGDQDINDGVNISLSPSVPPQGRPDFSMDAITRAITNAIQPVWAQLRVLEASIVGGQPRAPPRAGPGYRAEFIHHPPVPAVSAAPIAPVLTNQGTRLQSRIQATIPFPSANDPSSEVAIPTVSEVINQDAPGIDDEDFPALEQ